MSSSPKLDKDTSDSVWRTLLSAEEVCARSRSDHVQAGSEHFDVLFFISESEHFDVLFLLLVVESHLIGCYTESDTTAHQFSKHEINHVRTVLLMT